MALFGWWVELIKLRNIGKVKLSFKMFNLQIKLLYKYQNEGKSAAIFCWQEAAWVLDMSWNFYLVKNHKIVKNSATTKAGEKISTDLELLGCFKFLDVCLTKLKNNQTLLHKISQIYNNKGI